jgi:hypothetical protein
MGNPEIRIRKLICWKATRGTVMFRKDRTGTACGTVYLRHSTTARQSSFICCMENSLSRALPITALLWYVIYRVCQWIERFCNSVFFWFGNIGADAAIANLLPTLKRFYLQWSDGSRTVFETHAKLSQNCQRFCETLSQRNHVVLQSTAPLQIKTL